MQVQRSGGWCAGILYCTFEAKFRAIHVRTGITAGRDAGGSVLCIEDSMVYSRTQQRCCEGELKEYSTWTQLNPMVTRRIPSVQCSWKETSETVSNLEHLSLESRQREEASKDRGFGEEKVEAAGSMAGDVTDMRRRLQPYGVAAGGEWWAGQ